MEKSDYYIKRYLDDNPFPIETWTIYRTKYNHMKIGIRKDGSSHVSCVGKGIDELKNIEFWLEEL